MQTFRIRIQKFPRLTNTSLDRRVGQAGTSSLMFISPKAGQPIRFNGCAYHSKNKSRNFIYCSLICLSHRAVTLKRRTHCSHMALKASTSVRTENTISTMSAKHRESDGGVGEKRPIQFQLCSLEQEYKEYPPGLQGLGTNGHCRADWSKGIG